MQTKPSQNATFYITMTKISLYITKKRCAEKVAITSNVTAFHHKWSKEGCLSPRYVMNWTLRSLIRNKTFLKEHNCSTDNCLNWHEVGGGRGEEEERSRRRRRRRKRK